MMLSGAITLFGLSLSDSPFPPFPPSLRLPLPSSRALLIRVSTFFMLVDAF